MRPNVFVGDGLYDGFYVGDDWEAQARKAYAKKNRKVEKLGKISYYINSNWTKEYDTNKHSSLEAFSILSNGTVSGARGKKYGLYGLQNTLSIWGYDYGSPLQKEYVDSFGAAIEVVGYENLEAYARRYAPDKYNFTNDEGATVWVYNYPITKQVMRQFGKMSSREIENSIESMFWECLIMRREAVFCRVSYVEPLGDTYGNRQFWGGNTEDAFMEFCESISIGS